MRNYTVGHVWGIPIRISISLVVFLPVLVWLIAQGGQIGLYAGLIETYMGVALDVDELRAGVLPWVIGLLAAVGLFVSVTLHELGHSWVARRYGLDIESITLWILGGIAALGTVPREWDREFRIAIAGPITSVLVAVVCWAGLLLVPPSLPVVQFVVGWLSVVNLTLAGFNMLPAFPMDGGRVLRALLARSRPYATATRIAGRVGVGFAMLFAIVGAVSFNVVLLLLALFVYAAATTESRTVVIDELLEGITVGDIMTRDAATVPGDATVAEFASRMLRERRTTYPVTDGAGDVVGVVTLNDLRRIGPGERDSTRVESVMRDVPRVASTADAFETLALFNRSGAATALVEEDGLIEGVLSADDYARVLSIQRGV